MTLEGSVGDLFANSEQKRVLVKEPFVQTVPRVREHRSVRHEQCRAFANKKVFVPFLIPKGYTVAVPVRRRQR